MIEIYDNSGSADRGRELAERARSWIVSNPHAFRNVVDECRRIQGDHRMVSRDLVYTSLRMRHTGISDTTQYVKAHDLWSGIARYIARYYPDIEPSMAHCTIDDAYPSLEDMPPLPEEVLA